MKTQLMSDIRQPGASRLFRVTSGEYRGESTPDRAFSHRPDGGCDAPSAGRFTCGQVIPGLEIHGRPAPYPVVNERAVRATAGLMLIAAAFAFSQAFFLHNFLPLKIITPLFFLDFTLRVFTGLTPFSPFGLLGTLLVRNQRPEWAAATQKRFAWSIGIGVALLMTVITNMNITGVVPLAFCMMCMALMWMEAALGLCVGCVIYKWFVRRGWMGAPEYAPACGGGVCDPRNDRGRGMQGRT